jgi:hypothetical protein
VHDDVLYRIGPVDRPAEFHDLAGTDMAAVFVAGRLSWPDEPLFCREQSWPAPERGPALTYGSPAALGRVAFAHLN